MRTLILTICAVIGLSLNTAHGQWISFYGPQTPQGAYLNGLGQYNWGLGQYYRGLGQFGLDYQDAYSRYLDNQVKKTETFFEKRRLNKEYRKQPSWIEKENHRLDLAEERFALEQRRAQLIEKGVLPKPPKAEFRIGGKSYASYDAYKKSADYKEFPDIKRDEVTENIGRNLEILRNRGW